MERLPGGQQTLQEDSQSPESLESRHLGSVLISDHMLFSGSVGDKQAAAYLGMPESLIENRPRTRGEGLSGNVASRRETLNEE